MKFLKKYGFLGMGSFAGAVSRYGLESLRVPGYGGDIPLNTLFINLSGALVMAFLLTLAAEVLVMDADLRLGLTTGFLGAYTTFSTLCREVSTLLLRQRYASAFAYAAASLVLGLAAAYAGAAAARAVGAARERKAGPNAAGNDEGEEWE